MKEIKTKGKTVTFAVEAGLTELGLRRDQVEVEVLDEGTTGFLGLGSKPAEVRLREKIWTGDAKETPSNAKPTELLGEEVPPPHVVGKRPTEPPPSEQRASKPARTHRPKTERPEVVVDPEKACAAATEVLREILALTGIKNPEVRCQWDKEQGRVMAEVDTEDSALIIGKGGRTIEALQFLVTVIVGRKTGAPTAIQVDTQGYWKKIESKILEEVDSAIEEIKKTGKAYKFDPLEPSLRRLIHRKLADHSDVVTASEGEGPWRKVVIKPRR